MNIAAQNGDEPRSSRYECLYLGLDVWRSARFPSRFGVSMEDAALVRARLENVADVVEPAETLGVIADDPDDNRVLECALAGGANVIVSGDRHLLRLAKFKGISIVTVRQFMESIEATEQE